MKRKFLILLLLVFCMVNQVYAITSDDVTYNNNGTTESLTDSLDILYGELKKYKTGGSVQPNQMLEGTTGYSRGLLVTGTIPSKQATTYTPGTSNQTILEGQYLSGVQTIRGDANLTSANIAAGKTIFGIEGVYTSDANALASDMIKDKTAYVNGNKITGTIENHSGKTVVATHQVVSGNQLLIDIPLEGYYGTNSKIQTSVIGGTPTLSIIERSDNYVTDEFMSIGTGKEGEYVLIAIASLGNGDARACLYSFLDVHMLYGDLCNSSTTTFTTGHVSVNNFYVDVFLYQVPSGHGKVWFRTTGVTAKGVFKMFSLGI